MRPMVHGSWRGSAPRVRGTARAARRHEHRDRFSPACAGNGKIWGIARGVTGGSAPRVRGTARLLDLGGLGRRFSPACAGNGSASTATRTRRTVQPRVCGERSCPGGRRGRWAGSAPRVRGTVRRALAGRPVRRFSPACAGNGSTGRSKPLRGPVQPRVCGERLYGSQADKATPGSAPRVRGTGDARGTGSRRSSVQPRVCGERHRYVWRSATTTGSAPRVRGTAAGQDDGPLHVRFSPACAGNGARWPSPRRTPAVQPRVCGERIEAGTVRQNAGGSAPRVRGTGSGAER